MNSLYHNFRYKRARYSAIPLYLSLLSGVSLPFFDQINLTKKYFLAWLGLARHIFLLCNLYSLVINQNATKSGQAKSKKDATNLS